MIGQATPYGPKYPSNGYNSEDHFLCEGFKWAWNTFPDFRRTFFHPANEGKKNIVQAKQDEAKGMLKGAYDLIFLVPGFVVEFKQPGKQLSDGQEKFKEAMVRFNVPNFKVEYMEDFQRIVRDQFGKVKV